MISKNNQFNVYYLKAKQNCSQQSVQKLLEGEYVMKTNGIHDNLRQTKEEHT